MNIPSQASSFFLWFLNSCFVKTASFYLRKKLLFLTVLTLYLVNKSSTQEIVKDLDRIPVGVWVIYWNGLSSAAQQWNSDRIQGLCTSYLGGRGESTKSPYHYSNSDEMGWASQISNETATASRACVPFPIEGAAPTSRHVHVIVMRWLTPLVIELWINYRWLLSTTKCSTS